MPPLRAELHVSIIQDFKGDLGVEITSQLAGNATRKSTASISSGQVFIRLEELLSNQLRLLANEMETQLKKQRKGQT